MFANHKTFITPYLKKTLNSNASLLFQASNMTYCPKHHLIVSTKQSVSAAVSGLFTMSQSSVCSVLIGP